MTPRYLADTSALARMHHSAVRDVLAPLIAEAQVATCGVLELEILYSSRTFEDFRAIRAERARAFALVPIDQRDFDRAVDVMESLAARGEHRGASIPDLLIAAVAERAKLILLHYDRDFDRISRVTGQRARWVARPGSVP